MENTHVAVRFENNNSSKWDGKEAEVPGRTVVRLGRRGEDRLEKAEVCWPGKGKTGKVKVWRCVVLEGEEEEEGQTARMRKPEPETYIQRPAADRSAKDTDTPRTPAAPPRPWKGQERRVDCRRGRPIPQQGARRRGAGAGRGARRGARPKKAQVMERGGGIP